MAERLADTFTHTHTNTCMLEMALWLWPRLFGLRMRMRVSRPVRRGWAHGVTSARSFGYQAFYSQVRCSEGAASSTRLRKKGTTSGTMLSALPYAVLLHKRVGASFPSAMRVARSAAEVLPRIGPRRRR